MTSLGTLLRFTGLALVLSAAACADSITKGEGKETDYAALWRQLDQKLAGEKAPIVVATAMDGKEDFFLHGGPPPAPGLFQYVKHTGSGFTPGSVKLSRAIAVSADGTRREVGSGRGVIGADGTLGGSYGSNCPSGWVEFYQVVIVDGRTVESNHVVPKC